MRADACLRPHPTLRHRGLTLPDDRTFLILGPAGGGRDQSLDGVHTLAAAAQRRALAARAHLPGVDDAGAVRAHALVQLPQLDPDVAGARPSLDRLRELPLRADRRSDLPHGD